jgi:hypothetical protein
MMDCGIDLDEEMTCQWLPRVGVNPSDHHIIKGVMVILFIL